ncbi:MAG TPA: zf-HC2 domain-containing protein [Candidatus Acidoferrales bacterium]|nr:zf-HC2 domain-containing protein [Candidatus Acidoferrales bacterium]
MSTSDQSLANHFDEVTGLLYLEGQLDEDHAKVVAAHVASCAPCRQLLHALESEGVWLRESLTTDDEPIPAHLIAAPERNSTHWGWIAAFGLCAGGLYTLWNGIVEPWLASISQAGLSQQGILTWFFFQGAFWKGWDAMRSLAEFMAIATLGSLAIWLFRKQWKRFTPIAFVMGALACALALPPAAAAADVERGDPSYTLPAGHEVKNDLVVAADRTRIDGDVDGDLIVFSYSVTVNGHVKGDVLGLTDKLTLNGIVDGNVRVATDSIAINGSVGKNITAWQDQFDLDEKAKVGGSLTLLAGNADLDGQIGGDLTVLARVVDLNGLLSGSALIRSQRLVVGPQAEIQGKTKFSGWHPPEVAQGAKLSSPIDVSIKGPGPDYASGRYYWHQTLFWGASFIFGLVLLLVAPQFFFDVVQCSKRVGPALGLGTLFLLATPIAAVIVCATIVGAAVGVIAVLLWLIGVYSAQIFTASWLGEKLLGGAAGASHAIGRMALGLAIIRALTMLPYAGPIVGFCVTIWGLGAIVLTIHRRMQVHAPVAA